MASFAASGRRPSVEEMHLPSDEDSEDHESDAIVSSKTVQSWQPAVPTASRQPTPKVMGAGLRKTSSVDSGDGSRHLSVVSTTSEPLPDFANFGRPEPEASGGGVSPVRGSLSAPTSPLPGGRSAVDEAIAIEIEAEIAIENIRAIGESQDVLGARKHARKKHTR